MHLVTEPPYVINHGADVNAATTENGMTPLHRVAGFGSYEVDELLLVPSIGAAQGHFGAQIQLGTSYAFGDAVPEDLLEAYMWFMIALDHAPPGSFQQMVAKMMLEATADDLSRSEIRSAKRMAKEWLADHAER